MIYGCVLEWKSSESSQVSSEASSHPTQDRTRTGAWAWLYIECAKKNDALLLFEFPFL